MAAKTANRKKVEKFLFETLGIEHAQRVEIGTTHINVWTYKRDEHGKYVTVKGQPQVEVSRIEYDREPSW